MIVLQVRLDVNTPISQSFQASTLFDKQTYVLSFERHCFNEINQLDIYYSSAVMSEKLKSEHEKRSFSAVFSVLSSTVTDNTVVVLKILKSKKARF